MHNASLRRKSIAAFAVAAIASLSLASFAPSPAAAQSRGVNGTAPAARGTAQRQALLDAVRPPVEAELGLRIVFVVECIQVSNGWSLVAGTPIQRNGREIPRRNRPRDDDFGGLSTTAVLNFRGGRWVLVDHVIGLCQPSWPLRTGGRQSNASSWRRESHSWREFFLFFF